ncbi:MAG: GTP-binding protein LepA [Candidatus Curtissbacteria bacterium GW2011_GWA1_40_24]|uniref:Elongation factor 4 n=3 Tax=Patescibacteria group TaxID=1783273 RepID=A0A0G0FX32_9BACT|nr:MAG: GTP-binding protein LepA [Candidatus Wolfebacteria bacterium GW2011_GWC1_37_10]KKR55714.1 MAG: GTP-binding protein LepA [Candidatus Curtissbacteria bacterium GW2011_GWA1_40_24]KKR89054.1 MAG: GTP-binding protein LepA [Candidatus Wolfebacteria bacterium GW2011_GWB1_41_12]
MNNIRNFVIISHIDHGKSTLADRLLEMTGTVESRQMKPQFLDSLESERERGITIKMAPVRMHYNNFILNLIDTPGHSDFSYEVSRALAAVEGAILLVDATQGIQAQTLAKFHAAKKQGLKIIGAVNKIDLIKNLAEAEGAVKELADLIGCQPEEIHRISGKTGEGVKELLGAVIQYVPSPREQTAPSARALIFDSFYDDHKGIIASIRIFNGEFENGDEVNLITASEKFKIKEMGCFSPKLKPTEKLSAGEIGYIVTGLKEPEKIKIGDTVINGKSQSVISKSFVLEGYQEPKPVVFVSFYPDDADDYENLKKSIQRLKLNDSALNFEADFNEILGRGFKMGFLGKLHFEITAERLEKEFNIKTVNTFPSVAYKLEKEGKTIENPADLPDDLKEIWEPMISVEIITPIKYIGNILQLKENFRMKSMETKNLGERVFVSAEMPLAELISGFDDRLKSVSEGFASFSYEFSGYEKADLKKMEILVANSPVAGFTRVIFAGKIEREARKMVEKLKEILPHQQFNQAIQAMAGGRIIARETIPALKKDVTGYLYGGDRTRKMKLWKKQKKGKKKLLSLAKVRIPAEVFKKIIHE